MQRFPFLQVATKDRPKTFRAIVFSLFSLSLFVIVASVVLRIKGGTTAPDTVQVSKSRTPSATSAAVPTVAAVRR